MDLMVFLLFVLVSIVFYLFKNKFIFAVICGLLLIISGLWIYTDGLTRTESFLSSTDTIITENIQIIAPGSLEAFVLLVVLALGGAGLVLMSK